MKRTFALLLSILFFCGCVNQQKNSLGNKNSVKEEYIAIKRLQCEQKRNDFFEKNTHIKRENSETEVVFNREMESCLLFTKTVPHEKELMKQILILDDKNYPNIWIKTDGCATTNESPENCLRSAIFLNTETGAAIGGFNTFENIEDWNELYSRLFYQ